jgi:hypothetical protein
MPNSEKPGSGRDAREMRFKPGDRVQYRLANQQTGVIQKPYLGPGGDWWVLWDGGQQLPAFESNMLFEVLNASE